jgi:uncharacterized cupredoxin-like copper-binding protein
VLLLVLGLGVAVVLVLLNAALASAPAAAPDLSRPGTADAPRAVNVIMRDYRFDPTPLHLVPGETVRLSVVNGGLVEHELVLGDATVQSAWASADAQATAPAPFTTAPPASVSPGIGGLRLLLGSGGSAVVDYRVPSAGSLMLICHLPGHADRGMVGQVLLTTP